MNEFLVQHYPWLKALHVIAVISWMAGLLYLPRLFVYHAQAEKGSELSETLKIMERKLYRLIMNPAMVAVWVLAALMISADPALAQQHWLHAKFALVVLLTAFHHLLGRWRRKFLYDENRHDHKFYRKINEIPTILMILIVILVVVRPF